MSKQTLVSRVDISSALRYSGSQTVRKGVPVTWILDEFEAFKIDEKCRISMDATPFVLFQAGAEFIIKKGAVYVFDRDTTVALAYPQEDTQDIIIENKNYNDVKNNITIEADKTPVAHAGSAKTITIGESVTFIGSAYAIPPATLASHLWLVNGQARGSSTTLTYTPSAVGRDDITYRVTDSDGRMGQDTTYVNIEPKPTYPDFIQGYRETGGVHNGTGTYTMLRADISSPITDAVGDLEIEYMMSVQANSNSYSDVKVILYRDNVVLASKVVRVQDYRTEIVRDSIKIADSSVPVGYYTIVVSKQSGGGYYNAGNVVSGGSLQFKITNRTK